MNKGDSIMIFGAGMLQISIIKKANELGFFTIVIDPDSNALGRNMADQFYVVAGTDFEKTLKIAKTHNIKGLVTAATDKPLLMMARIADKLNLPFPTEKAISNTINKFELKKILLKNNIPCAKGILTNLEELSSNLEYSGISFPVIVKPIDSSGSRGVYYCKSIDELIHVYAECIKYSKFDKILIEEYLEGPEISVEALVQEKVLYIVQITDKTVTPFPYNVEMGHLQPSRFFAEYFDEIYQILSDAVKALELDNCALHPEMKITKEGIKIVEIGPRLGGDFITSHLTPLSTGINIEEQLLKIAIGEKIQIKNGAGRFSSVQYFDLKNNPININIIKSQVKLLKGKISSFEIYYNEDSELPIITNSLERHGHVVYSADSLAELVSIKEQLINL